MNSHEQEEVNFWRNLVSQMGDAYEEYRLSELKDKTEHFPSFALQEGHGLDLGCGLLSVLERSGKDFVAIDPLMPHYNAILPLAGRKAKYADQPNPNTIDYADGSFDWVFCVNVIDHTADSQKLADEMYRVLKPGGTLYFEVNFDDQLSPAHYGIWSTDMVAKIFNKFSAYRHDFERRDGDHQTRYWIEMKKV